MRERFRVGDIAGDVAKRLAADHGLERSPKQVLALVIDAARKHWPDDLDYNDQNLAAACVGIMEKCLTEPGAWERLLHDITARGIYTGEGP